MSEEMNEVEVEIEVESNDVEVEKNEVPEIKEPEVKKPWEKVEDKEEKIPYSRFKEVNEEKKLYKEKLEQYERELNDLREKVEPKKKEIEDPDELDPNDYETVKEYLAARDKVQGEKIQKQFLERMERQQAEKEVKEVETKIATEFNERATKASETNPDIIPAIQYIERFAEHIPAQVRYALLTDENSADLCYAIATDEEFLKLVVQGNPIEAIRKMSKWSAKFEKTATPTKETKKEEQLEDIRAMVPKTVKGTISSKGKDPSKMTLSEYRKYRGM